MRSMQLIFFFNDAATTEIYTLSLHDALPIFSRALRFCPQRSQCGKCAVAQRIRANATRHFLSRRRRISRTGCRSEEHTSELQSRQYLVCRLLLEKKNLLPPTTILKPYDFFYF